MNKSIQVRRLKVVCPITSRLHHAVEGSLHQANFSLLAQHDETLQLRHVHHLFHLGVEIGRDNVHHPHNPPRLIDTYGPEHLKRLVADHTGVGLKEINAGDLLETMHNELCFPLDDLPCSVIVKVEVTHNSELQENVFGAETRVQGIQRTTEIDRYTPNIKTKLYNR